MQVSFNGQMEVLSKYFIKVFLVYLAIWFILWREAKKYTHNSSDSSKLNDYSQLYISSTKNFVVQFLIFICVTYFSILSIVKFIHSI